MASNPLQLPVGALFRVLEPLEARDSIRRAANLMRESGVSTYPVVIGQGAVGVVTTEALASALSFGMEDASPVGNIVTQAKGIIRPYATGAEAVRAFDQAGIGTLIVCDEEGFPLGVLSSSDLFGVPNETRPRSVGGMATPFGVYLTNGVVRGGVGSFALIVTGAMLFLFIFLSGVLAGYLVDPLLVQLQIPSDSRRTLLAIAQVAIFLLSFRLLPLSAIHAAEHMVVHAMERGEELDPEIVSRMPRVHPRCGTNIAVGVGIFLAISSGGWHPDSGFRLIVAFFVSIMFWRPFGNLLQYYATTKTPSAKHLKMGIQAGKDLIRKYEQAPFATTSIGRKLLMSGLPEVMFGATSMMLILQLLINWVPLLGFLRVYL